MLLGLEMVQGLIAHIALKEDLLSVPSIHAGWLTTTCNANS